MKFEIDRVQFRKMAADEQTRFATEWFSSFHTDPVQEMPWVDGEYLYPYGGPYDAADTLYAKFDGLLDDSQIEAAVDELESDGTLEWAPTGNHPDQLQAFEEALQEQYEWFQKHELVAEAEEAIMDIELLLDDHRKTENNSLILRMIFVQCWSVLEAFLTNILIKHAQRQPEILNRLALGLDSIRDQSFSGKELATSPNPLLATTVAYIRRVAFHDPQRVQGFVECAFGKFKKNGIDCDAEISVFRSLEDKRHDCVHRNGKTLSDEPTDLTVSEVRSMIRAVDHYITKVGSLAATAVSNESQIK